MNTATPQSIVYRYTCITRRWWLNGGQESTQELALAVLLSVVANYFYCVELAIKTAKVVVEYAPLVWQLIVAGVYMIWAIGEVKIPATWRFCQTVWSFLNQATDDGLGLYGPSPMLQRWMGRELCPVGASSNSWRIF